MIKVICSKCQKEIVLFDNRYYGYDGMTSDNEEKRKYILHYKQRGKEPHSIEVAIENEPSLEDFNMVIGESVTYDFYSNSFSWIGIYIIDENGKKKKLYAFETS